jgi:hypothetical protein
MDSITARAASSRKKTTEATQPKRASFITVKQVEEKVIELIHRGGPHPQLAVDYTGAGFTGPDGGLIDIDFKKVRAIRLRNTGAIA